MEREEAIKIVRNIYQTDAEKEALETLVPELHESEDERIRKEIIDIVEAYRANCVYEGTHRFDDCLAYLEKQKEQKPPLYWHKIKTGDLLPCRAYIYQFAYEQKNNFQGRVTISGYLVPNEPVRMGCDTWYLPVEDIKNLPREE